MGEWRGGRGNGTAQKPRLARTGRLLSIMHRLPGKSHLVVSSCQRTQQASTLLFRNFIPKLIHCIEKRSPFNEKAEDGPERTNLGGGGAWGEESCRCRNTPSLGDLFRAVLTSLLMPWVQTEPSGACPKPSPRAMQLVF